MRPYGLLIMLQHRLGGEQAELFHELIEAREYGLALEEIASALAQDKIAITDQEHGDMLGRVAHWEPTATVAPPYPAIPGIVVPGQTAHPATSAITQLPRGID